MAGKSALVRHVLGVVRADETVRTTVLVAQSSAALSGVTLFTVPPSPSPTFLRASGASVES